MWVIPNSFFSETKPSPLGHSGKKNKKMFLTGFTVCKMMLQLVYSISQEYMYITSTNKFLDNTRQACHLFCKLLSSLSEVYFVNI